MSTPKKRVRVVFGRIRRSIDGKDMIFEMNKSGLRVREKYSRSEAATKTFTELADWINGQGKLL